MRWPNGGRAQTRVREGNLGAGRNVAIINRRQRLEEIIVIVGREYNSPT